MNPLYLETADIETASEDYASRFSGEVGKYFLDVQTQMTLKLLEDMPAASILDIGGGHAQLTRPLIDNGYEITVTGSDDVCRKRLDATCKKGSFTYQTCDSLNLPYSDNQFEVVMAFRLLPHAEKWQRLIQEMCRVSRKAVIFDYPDKRSTNILYNLLFKLKKNMEGNTRTYTLFTRKEIRHELAVNGFSHSAFSPEFFLPMVVHRKLKAVKVSKISESLCRTFGLTKYFGSPIIVRSNRDVSL